MTDTTEPDLEPRLPQEVLTLIVKDYMCMRENGMIAMKEELWKRTDPRFYPGMPLLLANRAVKDITIPLLYRQVRVRKGIQLIRYLNETDPANFSHLRSLVLGDNIGQRLDDGALSAFESRCKNARPIALIADLTVEMGFDRSWSKKMALVSILLPSQVIVSSSTLLKLKAHDILYDLSVIEGISKERLAAKLPPITVVITHDNKPELHLTDLKTALDPGKLDTALGMVASPSPSPSGSFDVLLDLTVHLDNPAPTHFKKTEWDEYLRAYLGGQSGKGGSKLEEVEAVPVQLHRLLERLSRLRVRVKSTGKGREYVFSRIEESKGSGRIEQVKMCEGKYHADKAPKEQALVEIFKTLQEDRDVVDLSGLGRS